MMGVWGGSRGLTLLMVLIGVLDRTLGVTYVEHNCYCYAEWDQTIKDAINAFKNLQPLAKYNYHGARYSGVAKVFSDCDCRDVTRVVTVLKVTEADYLTMASDATKTQELNTKVTKAVDTVLRGGLPDRLVSVTGQLDKASVTTTAAPFNVEVVLKGRDAALNTQVETKLKTDAMSGGSLAGVGTVDTAAMTFTVKACAADPAAALATGVRTPATPTKLAGEIIIYTCNANYRLSDKSDQRSSTCDHQTLKWTNPPTSLTCKEDMRCKASPPARPPHTKYDWDQTTIEQNTVIKYNCEVSYKSTGVIETKSTCTNKAWTPISTAIKCKFTGCPDVPPQVVDNGDINWNNKRDEGTQASYFCKSGYVSNINPKPILKCENKVWGQLPAGFQCRYEDAAPIQTKEENDSYLLNYTLPSFFVLVLIGMLILCCSRTDSPIFRCCRDRNSNNKMFYNP